MALPYQARSSFDFLPTPMELLHRIEQIVYAGDTALVADEAVSRVWGAEGGVSHHGDFSQAARRHGLRVGFDAQFFGYEVFSETGQRAKGHTPRVVLVTIEAFEFSEHTTMVIAPSEAVFFTWKRLSPGGMTERTCLVRNPAWLGKGYPTPKDVIHLGYPAFLGRVKADRVMAAARKLGYELRAPRPDELAAADRQQVLIAEALGIAPPVLAPASPSEAPAPDGLPPETSVPGDMAGPFVNWWEQQRR